MLVCRKLVFYISIMLILVSCSTGPHHDEVLPLKPGYEDESGTALRTQTLWTDDSEVVLTQVIKIGDQPVGVNYMYHRDFHSLPRFPVNYSFGKRLILLPPGNYDIQIYYKRQGRYLIESLNRKNGGYLTFKAAIPEDSLCAFIPDIESIRSDAHHPKIKLHCRKEHSGKWSWMEMFL